MSIHEKGYVEHQKQERGYVCSNRCILFKQLQLIKSTSAQTDKQRSIQFLQAPLQNYLHNTLFQCVYERERERFCCKIRQTTQFYAHYIIQLLRILFKPIEPWTNHILRKALLPNLIQNDVRDTINFRKMLTNTVRCLLRFPIIDLT